MEYSTKAKPGTKVGTLSPKATGHGPIYNIRQRARMTQQQFANETAVPLITIRRAEADGDYPQKHKHVMSILRFAKERDIEEPNIL